MFIKYTKVHNERVLVVELPNGSTVDVSETSQRALFDTIVSSVRFNHVGYGEAVGSLAYVLEALFTSAQVLAKVK